MLIVIMFYFMVIHPQSKIKIYISAAFVGIYGYFGLLFRNSKNWKKI